MSITWPRADSATMGAAPGPGVGGEAAAGRSQSLCHPGVALLPPAGGAGPAGSRGSWMMGSVVILFPSACSAGPDP